ncbi:rhomboid family intramembrane serine protease [Blastococcus saxobsidens]|uniref:Membrane associated rhomboid family serine protease n=1 Tax=Blastococcus saxobsidens TaxID=138336 RepID=A0A4V2G2N1_9ACTN|nr:rhomboid family intramembrane serine protease [Blastococcus saxobsidens]RZU33826.1 membrane associated rhomboid family serine protease [Blastococcus saxobsidens]
MIPASVGFQCPECVREGAATVRRVRSTGSGLRGAVARWGAVPLALIAANVAMFLVTAVSAGLAGSAPLDNYRSPVFEALAQVPLLVQLGEPWRLLTAAFLHIGLVHLALNMLALLVFGSELERQLGRWRFLGLYLVSALGGSTVIQLFGEPLRPVAGASTAIYGLLGALGVLMVLRRQDIRGILVLLAINVFISFLPGVSLLGHLGGLVTGAVVAALLVAARRRPALQGAGLAAIAVVLLALALTVPALAAVTV